MNTSLQVGDKISRSKANGLVRHEGVVVGFNQVFHSLPEIGPHISSVSDFAAGQSVTIVERNPGINTTQMLWRMNQLIREAKPYHPTDNNCQHVATYVLHGKPESSQLQGWCAVGALAFLALVASR